ncbi:hypothetical protein FPV67DRAFT_1453399 [Lyophyllum atratum]|nr:hypothetical protein FPV67DRAFT_1453399 [Lyophyllum atratum]
MSVHVDRVLEGEKWAVNIPHQDTRRRIYSSRKRAQGEADAGGTTQKTEEGGLEGGIYGVPCLHEQFGSPNQAFSSNLRTAHYRYTNTTASRIDISGCNFAKPALSRFAVGLLEEQGDDWRYEL